MICTAHYTSGDIDRVVEALQRVLLAPQSPESPLGTKYEGNFLAEDLFRQGEAYLNPTDRTEYEEAVYWNTAAARLGHHDALIRLGTMMMEANGTDSSPDVLEGLAILALGGLLSSRPIDLPDEPTRGPVLASSQLGRWVFKSSGNADSGYELYRWIIDAADAEELIAQ